MSELVAMKGTKSGIVIVLNEEAAFEELKQAVSEKFKESAAFWGEATKAVSFQGKKLSDDEKMQLVDCIQENCHLLIPCIMEEDEALETAFQNSIENRQEEIDYSTGQFFKGNLRSGQVLDVETSIIIIGDVKAGAKVVSKGNVIILGSLKGNVYADLPEIRMRLLLHWIWIRCRSVSQIRLHVPRISQERRKKKKPRLHFGKMEIFILNHWIKM